MKKQLSDEQIDKLMRTLVNSSAADEETINEIVNSPAIWWGVQRNLNSRRDATLSAWPPIVKVLRWLMVGVPVAAVLIISFFVFRPGVTSDNIVSSVTQQVSTAVVNTPSIAPIAESPSVLSKAVHNPAKIDMRKPARKQGRYSTTNLETKTTADTMKSAEIKTEFIALSYARDPESGQIVRVKVPSSMMVSLGLVVSVEKPSDLVDAEVLVGDDGLTRAIRFIR